MTPPDDVTVPAYPEPLTLDALPEHLRDNPVARLHLGLPPEVEAQLMALVADDETAIEELARELAAGAR